MTEPKRHPHADVLIAIAEGREVQYIPSMEDIWRTLVNGEAVNPISHHFLRWRVRPQKLKRWVNVYSDTHATREDADRGADGDRIACIEIEFEEGDGL